MSNELQPLQYMIKGVKPDKLLDSEFIKELKTTFGDFQIVNISIVVGEDDNKDIANIGYPYPIYQKNDQLILDTSFPETLNKLTKIIMEDK